MWADEIVDEIHRLREEYAKSLNNDLDAIFADLRQKEAASGKRVVTLSRKSGLSSRWSGRVRDFDGDVKTGRLV